jgi:HD-GYP domain-containing protein (c-di-GMP phosphodiesterase class II)
VKPAEASLPTATGTSATRRSPAPVSFGTATLTEIALYGAWRRVRKGTGVRSGKSGTVGSLLASFSAAIEARDPYLSGHSARVTSTAEGLARRLGWRGERLDALRLGGSLHDVGKIAVKESVLRKPGPLTDAELAEIRTHPVAGARLIEGVDDFRQALPYVLHHHERWDGTGYPDRLAGEKIPIEARLLGVADAFDAMTSVRSYRPALSVDRALAELQRCAGAQFDPELAETFVECWRAGDIAAVEPPIGIAS